VFHCPRVLYAAMNQLFLPIPFHLKGDDRGHYHGRNGNERYKQDEGD
jgi:hypothetical protein